MQKKRETFFPLSALHLIMKGLGKGFRKAERVYNNMDEIF